MSKKFIINVHKSTNITFSFDIPQLAIPDVQYLGNFCQ